MQSLLRIWKDYGRLVTFNRDTTMTPSPTKESAEEKEEPEETKHHNHDQESSQSTRTRPDDDTESPPSKRRKGPMKGAPETRAPENLALKKEDDPLKQSSQYPVIDETQALQQVDGDKEFLLELLGDLRKEVIDHTITIESAMVRPFETGWLETIYRAAHSIKGACANLMVLQLRFIAASVESTARLYHSQGDVKEPTPVLQERITELSLARDRFLDVVDKKKFSLLV